MRWLGARSRRAHSRSGMSLVEVIVALAVVTAALVTSVGAFSRNVASVESARNTSRAAAFLESVMENVAAQDFDALSAFDGDRVHEGETAQSSQHAVDLTVFTAGVDLVQIRAVLVELNTGREIGRATTLRSRR